MLSSYFLTIMTFTLSSENVCASILLGILWLISEVLGLTEGVEPNSIAGFFLIRIRKAIASRTQRNEGEEKER